jgi:DnaJ-class molecular chaperone
MGPTEQIESAFKLATHLLGVSEPVSRLLTELRRDDDEDDDDDAGEDGCEVCGGSLKVGRKGAEVDCPECVVHTPPMCATCGGDGEVGRVGHRVKCPVCRGKKR